MYLTTSGGPSMINMHEQNMAFVSVRGEKFAINGQEILFLTAVNFKSTLV